MEADSTEEDAVEGRRVVQRPSPSRAGTSSAAGRCRPLSS